jgi:predicted nucleic acid-binding protein
MDLQIAATAARHGLMLLTRNGSDFTGLQSALKIVDLPDRAPGTVG